LRQRQLDAVRAAREPQVRDLRAVDTGLELLSDRSGLLVGVLAVFLNAQHVAVLLALHCDDLRAVVAQVGDQLAQLVDCDVAAELQLDLGAAGEVHAQVRSRIEQRDERADDQDAREDERLGAVLKEVDRLGGLEEFHGNRSARVRSGIHMGRQTIREPARANSGQ
jgi:hypothetical protein